MCDIHVLLIFLHRPNSTEHSSSKAIDLPKNQSLPKFFSRYCFAQLVTRVICFRMDSLYDGMISAFSEANCRSKTWLWG
jgi:hypothetical protein